MREWEMLHVKVPMPEPQKICEVLGISMDKAEIVKDDRHTCVTCVRT